MAQGDIGYDRDTGEWVIEGDVPGDYTPLVTSTNPFYKEVWNILRQIQVQPGYSDADIAAIGQAAWRGAVGALAQERNPEPKATPPLRFDSKDAAVAEAALNGGVVVRRSDGFWGVEDAPQARRASQPSFEDEFNRLIFSGQNAKAEALWNARQNIISQGGRMTRAEAAQFLTGDLFKAEEIPALLQALMGPEPTFQQAVEETRLPGPLGEPGTMNIGGFFGPTREMAPFPAVPGAPVTGPFTAAANPQTVLNAFLSGGNQQVPRFSPGQEPGLTIEEFDPNFAGASPEAQAAIRAEFERRQSQGLSVPQQSFTQAIQADLAAVTNAQRTQVQAVAQQVQQQQEGQTGQAAEESPGFLEALRRGEAQLRGPITSADIGAGSTPGPAGQVVVPQTFEQAFEAQGGANRRGVFQVPQGMNPFDAAIRLSQTPEGLATSAAINAVTPEARAAMAREAEASPFNVANMAQRGRLPQMTDEEWEKRFRAGTLGKPPGTLTFAEALAQINQRRENQRLLRRPQGRVIFA